jgi:hypothetical protein
MNTSQSTLSSPRNQRILFWIGLLALVAGVVVLVIKLAGGSDSTAASPAKGFKPQLPAKQTGLTNSAGAKITNYAALDPTVKVAIKRFVIGAVAGKNYADSWNVIAPSMQKGYTAKSWTTSPAHPVIPYAVKDYAHSVFKLKSATTKAIYVGVKLFPQPNSGERPHWFMVGLEPAAGGKRWLVNYWMPLWTPPVADSSSN